jgi:tetratricopeptide (TPR) repeat protein
MKRLSIAGCSLVVLCGLARAQTARSILAKDNVGFGRDLYNAGFAELADRVCSALADAEKSGSIDPTEAISVKLLRLDLRLDAARREPDLIARKDLMKAVLKEKVAFIDEYTRTSAAQEARNELPETYRVLGETYTAALQKTQDPAIAATLRTEGQEIFTQAEGALKDRIETLKAIVGNPNAPNVAWAEHQLMVAYYNLARTDYYHSLLFAKDDPKKPELLGVAVKAFLEFGLAYGDQLLNYEGLIYQGLCHRDLGKTSDALSDFSDAIALRETYEKSDVGVYEMPPEAADIVSSAFVQKILLMTELKDFAGSTAAAKDYLATTPDALLASQGLAVLAAEADAQLAGGDVAGAGETAQKLVDANPEGPWGRRGKEILGKAIDHIDIGGEGMLKIAMTLLTNGQYERVLDVCLQARASAKGSPKAADVGAESYYIAGYAYKQLGRLHEAAIAWDAAAEQYPTGEKAPDALWNAVLAYSDLHNQERRPFYEKRGDDRMRTLASKYPKSPYASQAKIVQGKKYEDEQKYLQAAEEYQGMQPGTAGYEEGQYKAGKCYFLHARNLLASGKTEDAKNFFAKAEEWLKRTQTTIEKSLQNNLDPEVQARLGNWAFSARVTLAQLYLQPGVDRAAEVAPLLQDVEEKYKGDQGKLALTWGFRIQALQAQGQLQAAVDLLESLRAQNPDQSGLAAAAGVLARSLDAAGSKLFEKDAASKEGEEKWRKAAQYYMLSIRPALTDPALFKASDVADIANRLYAMGLHFNSVPGDTFVGWTEKPKDTGLWENAVTLYRAILDRAPDYRISVTLGRTLGLLGNWRESAEVFAKLFDSEKLFDSSGKRFNPSVLGAKPELVLAYLEWGVADRNAVTAEGKHDKASMARATGIFSSMVTNTEKDTGQLFWQARHEWIRCLIDQGDYEGADTAWRYIERTTNDFDQGKFGYKDKFKQLRTELDKKVFRKEVKQDIGTKK